MVSKKVTTLMFLLFSLCSKGALGSDEKLKIDERSKLGFSAADVLSHLSEDSAKLLWKRWLKTVSETNIEINFSANKNEMVQVSAGTMKIKGCITVNSDDEVISTKNNVTLEFSSATKGSVYFEGKLNLSHLKHPCLCDELHTAVFEIKFFNGKTNGMITSRDKVDPNNVREFYSSEKVAEWSNWSEW